MAVSQVAYGYDKQLREVRRFFNALARPKDISTQVVPLSMVLKAAGKTSKPDVRSCLLDALAADYGQPKLSDDIKALFRYAGEPRICGPDAPRLLDATYVAFPSRLGDDKFFVAALTKEIKDARPLAIYLQVNKTDMPDNLIDILRTNYDAKKAAMKIDRIPA